MVYACDTVLTEARSILAFGDAGGAPTVEWTGRAGAADFVDAGYDILADARQRERAALVCACRAREHRTAASHRGTESDLLVWFGAIGSICGGALESVAAAGVDSTTQKTLNQSGIGVLALGTLAFGLNAALNLATREAKHTTAAETQEYAAAILADDVSGPAAWRAAWASCVEAEGAESQGRLIRPQDALNLAAGADAGATSATKDGGVDGGPLSVTPEQVLHALLDGG